MGEPQAAWRAGPLQAEFVAAFQAVTREKLRRDRQRIRLAEPGIQIAVFSPFGRIESKQAAGREGVDPREP